MFQNDYQANGTYYTKEHSVSFGDQIIKKTTEPEGEEEPVEYWDLDEKANTWDTWHLIPSSRPSIAHPNPITKIIEIPGTDGVLDLSEYLTGRVNYGQRQGSLNFYVDNGHEDWESIRTKIVKLLHGKKMLMKLNDDPGYYYTGRFTVGNWESGANYSTISIGYSLAPYKIKITPEGTEPTLWDPFNFETDYDYYTAFSDAIQTESIPASYEIYMGEMPVALDATWVSGGNYVTFGGETKYINSPGTETVGLSQPGINILTLSGNGKVKISWRGGSL